VLGYALNDSGVAIPGVMLVIAIAAFVWLLVRFEPGDRPDDGERPDEDQDALRAEPPAVESVTTAAARS